MQLDAPAGWTSEQWMRAVGGIYQYFRDKEALLETGMARHRQRLDALRDTEWIMFGGGDPRPS